MKIHQMGSVLATGDAITHDIIEIDRRLVVWGYQSAIYGADVTGVSSGKAQLDTAYEPFLDEPSDVLIYHYSAYCDNLALFRASRNHKIVVYHNITPANFFRPYDGLYTSLCERGRKALSDLRDCELALADSEYNRLELVAAGFVPDRTRVLPIFLSTGDLTGVSRDEAFYRRLKADGRVNILFVGKVAPNKAFEDLIKIFYHYQRYVQPHSRLILAGARFLRTYDRALDDLVARLGLSDVVLFTNRIPLAQLKSCYEAAQVFLCASRHEGFCVPLVEAMYFDLPILARSETAVPYTLGSAGVQFHCLDYPAVAEMLNMLAIDGPSRDQVLAAQRRRLADFAPDQVAVMLADALATCVGLEIRTQGTIRPTNGPVEDL